MWITFNLISAKLLRNQSRNVLRGREGLGHESKVERESGRGIWNETEIERREKCTRSGEPFMS